MNRPSFQFYTKDWRSNSKLRRCSPAARGVWVDILCALHDSDEYGVARYPLKELASEVGASTAHVRELVDKGVLKGHDVALTEAFVYVPRSGRKDGDPVLLVPEQPGPIWYSSRMVKDEYVRANAGASTRFGSDPPPAAPAASTAGSAATSDGKARVPGKANGSHHHGASGTGSDGHQLITLPDDSDRQSETPRPAPTRRHGEDQSDGSSTASASATAVLTPYAPHGALSPAVPADRPPLTLVAIAQGPPPCPHERIVEAYHRLLPSATRIRKMTVARRGHLAARWKEEPKRQSVGWWEKLFAYAADSPFLTGQVPGRDGKPPFELTIDFLIESEDRLIRLIEGRYHRREQA